MKRNFARHGIPQDCVSVNGPQFDSYEYANFAKEYWLKSTKSSRYHSQENGNGKAESAVKVAKNILKKTRNEDPHLALLAYSNTPKKGYTYSLSQMLMSRRLRDTISTLPSQLQPHPVPKTTVAKYIAIRRARSKQNYDKKASRPLKAFLENDNVFVKPLPGNKHKPWIGGTVMENYNRRSCVVQTPIGRIRRNHKKIRKGRTRRWGNKGLRMGNYIADR